MTYAATVVADTPMMYARLGGTTFATATADASGSGRNGTSVYLGVLYGQTGLLPVADPTDSACLFSGSGGALVWASASWLNVASVTLEAWIRPTNLSSDRAILDRDHGTGRQFQFRVSGGKLQLIYWTVASGVNPVFATGATTLTVNTTYHVVATYDAATGTGRVYVNGVQDASTTGAVSNLAASGSNPFAVGGSYGGGGAVPSSGPFLGTIDEAAVYGGALSAARVLAHYTAGTTVPPPEPVPGPPVRVAASRTHQPLWRVRMLTAGGTQIGEPLPFVGGTISKTTSVTPRCRATVDVPTGMVPALIDQNYIPTGQRLVFDYKILGAATDWQVIADLDMVGSTITRPDSMWRLEAADRSIRVALDDTARGGWVEPTGTIDSAIRYIINRTFPGSTFSTSGPALTQTVPTGTKTDGDPWSAAVGLATAAQSEVFHRAIDRVFVVRPLPVLAASATDSLKVGADGTVTVYDLVHEMGFNTVAISWQDTTGGTILRVGTWVDTRTDSPVAKQRIGSNVVYRETRKANAAPSQVEADAAAAALGKRVAGRARSPTIRHVSRPWLEPGDTIAVTYSGGPTELQLVDSVDIPLDNSNIQTTTCRSSEYKMGVPV